MSYQKMIAEKAEIEQKILQFEEAIEELPEGELLCAGNGEYCKWYYKLDGQKQYLPKKRANVCRTVSKKEIFIITIKRFAS